MSNTLSGILVTAIVATLAEPALAEATGAFAPLSEWAQLGVCGLLGALLWWQQARTIPLLIRENRAALSEFAAAKAEQTEEFARLRTTIETTSAEQRHDYQEAQASNLAFARQLAALARQVGGAGLVAWAAVAFARSTSAVEAVQTGRPALANVPPSLAVGGDFSLSDAELKDWLDSSQHKIQRTPLELECGATLEPEQGKRVVYVGHEDLVAAGDALTSDTFNVSQWQTPAAMACIQSKYANLRVTVGATASISGANFADGSVTVGALSRALPAGAALQKVTTDGGTTPSQYLQLTSAAGVGATSLAAQKFYADVALSNGDVLEWGGRYYNQGAANQTTIRDVLIVGDPPTPLQDPWSTMGPIGAGPGGAEVDDPADGETLMIDNAARAPLICDGLVLKNIGARPEGVVVTNFPGTGIRLEPVGSASTNVGQKGPYDAVDEISGGAVYASKCYVGVAMMAGDSKLEKIVAKECRDIDVLLSGINNHVGICHGYGGDVAVAQRSGAHIGLLDAADAHFCWELGSGQTAGVNTSARLTNVGSANLYSYTKCYRSLGCVAEDVTVSALKITQTQGATTARDPLGLFSNQDATNKKLYYSNVCVALGSFAKRFQSPATDVLIQGANGTSGITIGTHTSGAANEGLLLHGVIETQDTSSSTTDWALRIRTPVKEADVALKIRGGFAKAIVLESTADIEGRLELWGVGTLTIDWPDGTTGTFAAPNVPATISDNCEVIIHAGS